MGFYNKLILEKGLENMTEEIAGYLSFEESYIKDTISRSFFGKNPRILDVGCGNGRVLKLLEEICGEIHGIDFAKTQTREAKKNVLRSEIIEGDAAQLPYKNQTFDCIICAYNTFGNIPDEKITVLKEMGRVLKEGGLGIVSVYAEEARSKQGEFYKSLGLEIEDETEDAISLKEGLHSGRFTIDMFEGLFRAAGLRYENITEVKIKDLRMAYICELKKIH